MFKKLLVLAVMASFMLCAGVASADWSSPPTAVKTSTALDSTLLDGVYPAAPVYRLDASSVTSSAGFTVTVTNGALVKTDTTLDVADDYPGYSGDSDLVSIFSLNSAKTELKLSTSATLSSGHTITIQDSGNTSLSVDASSANGSDVTLTMTVGDSFQGQVVTKETDDVTLITFTDLISQNSGTTASSSSTIDVAADKLKLVGDTTVASAAVYKVDASSITTAYNESATAFTGIAASKLLFTIAGDMGAVSGISAGASVTSANSAGTSTGGTASKFTIDTTNNMAYAVNNTALTPGNQATTGNIVVTFDGTTVIPEGTWTIAATALATSAQYSEVALGEFTFLTLSNNGFQFVVPYFNSNITTYNSTVVLNNGGSDDAPVAVEVIATSDTAALPVGTSGTMATLAAGATAFYNGQAFLDALGLTDGYGGTALRAALEVTVTAAQDDVTGLMFQANSDGSKRTVPLLIDVGTGNLRYGW